MSINDESTAIAKKVDEDVISSLLANFDCQPVLFVGAGMARRFLGAPDWAGALQNALSVVGADAPDFEYFLQKNGDDLVACGTDISEVIFEWAWKDKSRFHEDVYKAKDRSIFLKKIISDQISALTANKIPDNLVPEIESLKKIRPHAVITTNYDKMLEGVFEGYEAIVGKGVLKYNINSFGEIFHIHGIVDDPLSMVLVNQDYERWHIESQYFAAKLLAYFVEHPIFIFGYGLGDPNIRTVLSDIGRIVADDDGLISNVVQVVWKDGLDNAALSEYAIEEGGNQYRIRVIKVGDLCRIFDFLSARHELKNVNAAMVRALAARVMKLTRRDIPNGDIEVDFATLERLACEDSELPTMLGLTIVEDLNKSHPFALSMAAEKLGLNSFNPLVKVIKLIHEQTGINLRETDNKYHCTIKTGKSSQTHKWSHDAVMLFEKVLKGEDYTVDL
jgi:SIR2-like domain